jgi:steroid 5-alpha reductase family enzyme
MYRRLTVALLILIGIVGLAVAFAGRVGLIDLGWPLAVALMAGFVATAFAYDHAKKRERDRRH